MQAANGVNAFVFDKTGTLTEGKPVVTNVKVIDTGMHVTNTFMFISLHVTHGDISRVLFTLGARNSRG